MIDMIYSFLHCVSDDWEEGLFSSRKLALHFPFILYPVLAEKKHPIVIPPPSSGIGMVFFLSGILYLTDTYSMTCLIYV